MKRRLVAPRIALIAVLLAWIGWVAADPYLRAPWLVAALERERAA